MSLDLQPGDVVKVTRTVVVNALTPDMGDGNGLGIYGGDAGDSSIDRFFRLNGSTVVEMVKRVARRKPQRGDFKIGDKVTADQLREVMWRRGTMICPNHHLELASVLHGDGRWHALNGEAWDFAKAEGKFELLYLPD